MLRRRLAVAALLLAAALPPGTARAQDRDKLCRDMEARPMRVGQWASYAWSGGRVDGSTMRFAIVGTEVQEGTTYHWYEMAIDDGTGRPRGRTVMQMLVSGLGYQAGGVRGMIMKSGAEPAMRMPDQMLRMMSGRAGQNVAAEIARGCAEMELVGWEQVTVPAGTFRALHVRNPREQTEAWIAPDLYFGMVKVTMKDGAAMVLTRRGSDAQSSISERPARPR